MKVDFSTVLMSLDGQALQREAKSGVPKMVDGAQVGWVSEPVLEDMQLKHACIDALMAADREERDGNAKFKKFQLATSIAKGGEQEISPEDCVLIKNALGPVFAPIVVGRAFELLNG